MSQELENSLLSWATEALELRHGEAGDPDGKVGLPPYELGTEAYILMLQRVRQRLDRTEELQSKARQAKGRVTRLREQSAFEASLAYDTALQKGKLKFQEYVSAAEKSADATLASIDEKRKEHQMKRLESVATETYDVISQCYWGLEKLREDVKSMLRTFQFISSEEVQT